MDLLFYFNLLLQEKDLTEIIINSTKSILLISNSHTRLYTNPFNSSDDLRVIIQKFCYSQKLRLDPKSPSCGGELRYKTRLFRWHTVIEPIASEGPIFSIRLHNFEHLTITNFIADTSFFNDFNHQAPILFAGPTGSGKTSFLSAYIRAFLVNQRVFILDSTQELKFDNPFWFNLGEGQARVGEEAKVSLSEAFEESLRLFPDRFIFGELRKKEGQSFYRSLFTGHKGSISTMHCDDITLIIERLASLCDVSTGELTDLFNRLNPVVFMLKRPPNRLRGAYRFCNNQWEELLLFTK